MSRSTGCCRSSPIGGCCAGSTGRSRIPFPARRPITVEDLLTFRLGWGLILAAPGTLPIQQAIADLGIVGFGPPDPSMPYDADEWLRRLATLPLFAQPGEAWMYTTGSDIQGVLVARASGQAFGAFLQERIFAPLGMADTGFFVPAEKLDRLVTAYQPRDGRLELFDAAATGGWSRPPAFEQGDAGLVSTADDFLAFSRLLLNGGTHDGRRLLSEASVRAMTRNHLTPAQMQGGALILGPGHGWGYGMSVVVDAAAAGAPEGTIGWIGGYGTKWQSNPATGLTTILLTQRVFESPEPPPVFEAFEEGARQVVSRR